MQDLIEKLNRQIKDCDGEDPDSASWGYEEGVLITPNEAKRIVMALSTSQHTTPADVNTHCDYCKDYKKHTDFAYCPDCGSPLS